MTMTQPASISPLEFDFLQRFFKKHSGYHLTKEKEYLLTSSLHPTMKKHQINSFSELVQRLNDPASTTLGQEITQAMTINETMFFRDKNPFEQLEKNILPELASREKNATISIWCAACSSGQEPYSVAMLIDSQRHKFPGKKFHIYATDIADDMVQRGKKGVYSDLELRRSLSPEFQNAYFQKISDTQWKINDAIRNMVTFETLNILDFKPSPKQFDLVLCRNVLFYFDKEDKIKALHNVRQTMRHPAYLLVGVSEILTQLSSEFKMHPEWRSVYTTTAAIKHSDD